MEPEPADWMVPADEAVLTVLAVGLRLTIKGISVNSEYERHYISRRCRQLKAAGLVFKDESDMYVLTPYGERYLDGDVPPESIAEGPPEYYRGERRTGARDVVFADGVALPERVNFHSQTINEVSWGYNGLGPRNLAKCLIADVTDGATAMACYEAILADLLIDLDGDWELTAAEITTAVEAHQD